MSGRRILPAAICLFALASAQAAPPPDDPMHGPWDAGTAARRAAQTSDTGFSFPGGVLDLALAAYQRVSSASSTARCPMTPSCSAYAREAIAKYGPIRGSMMAVDRLYHEQGLIGEVPPVIQSDGSVRWLDPPSENVPVGNP